MTHDYLCVISDNIRVYGKNQVPLLAYIICEWPPNDSTVTMQDMGTRRIFCRGGANSG